VRGPGAVPPEWRRAFVVRAFQGRAWPIRHRAHSRRHPANFRTPRPTRSSPGKGAFDEYLELVKKNPAVTRHAYQRLYDMILSHGVTKYTDHKKEVFHYKFFDDPIDQGKEAIFGPRHQLMKLVNVLKAAARRYEPGAPRAAAARTGRLFKSTIVRLLKKGIEYYSRTVEGALYTFQWRVESAYGDSAKATTASTAPCTRIR